MSGGRIFRSTLRRLHGRPVLLALLAVHSQATAAPPARSETSRRQRPDTAAVSTPSAGSVQEEQAIVVTGSRIPRRNLIETSPVTMIDSQEVKFEGTTNVEELLNQLPQVAPTQGAFISNGATGTATVDLRSLGPPRTLVLINGRRLGPGDPTQPSPDLNMIPPTLIKRIEVLTGGASSVYGSDAVSGVVNFILDTSLDGIRLDGESSLFQHYNHTRGDLRNALDQAGFPYPVGNTIDGGRTSINAAVGKKLFDGRAHVSLYAGYTKTDGLTQAGRDYSACAAQVNADANTLLRCGGSMSSYPGNVRNKLGEVFFIGPDRTFVPGFTLFNFAPSNYYQRPDRRYTAGGFADAEISDALKPYLEVMYLNDQSVAQIAPSGDFANTRTINCDNPLLSAQQLSHVCIPGNFVGQTAILDDDDGSLVGILGTPTAFFDPVTGGTYFKGNLNVQRRNVEGGPRQQDLRHEALRLAGGLRGDLARGISYDSSYIYSNARMASNDTGFFSVVRLRRALDVVSDPATGEPACRSKLTGQDPACVPWDIFTPGAVSQTAVDYLTVAAHRHGHVEEQVANFNSTINLGDWGVKSPWSVEGPSVNAGAEYRKDKLSYVPDPLQFTGDLAGAGNAQLPAHGTTQVKELFAETRIPIIDRGFVYGLALEAGYRQSWYSNDQSKVSADAYKLAVELAPVRGLRFRASLQRAVRAPNIVELFTPAVDDAFDNDPCAGINPQATLAQCQNTGVTPAQYGHVVRQPAAAFVGYNSIVGGNPELKPETARTRTIGLVLEPRFLPGFNATIDWWDIDLKGAIAQVGAQLTMDSCIATADPAFCGRIHRDSDGSLWLTPDGYIDDRNFNIGAFKVRGVDVGVNYRRPLGSLGSAEIGFLGTYYDKWVIEPGGLAEPFDCVGLYGVDCGIPQPRWRHKARLTWTTRSDISLSASWRYTGSMKLAPIPDYTPGPYTKVLKAQSYFDLSAIARIGKDYALRLGVNNILDREPPLVPAGGEGACEGGCNGNTYPQWYDPLGRFIFVGVTMNFKPF
jgi:iron complex outermembrane receptor protein